LKSRIARGRKDRGMSECVAHSRADSRQWIASEAFSKVLDFAVR
jgi:hypothetical protein